MDYAVVYHFWGEKSCITLNVPIIFSIASIRAHNKEISIYVLDCSDGAIDWFEFPQKLNFKVIKWKFLLKRTLFKGNVLWKHTSKIFDLEEFAKTIPESNIIFCDSDIACLRNILPLQEEAHLHKICCRPENTGFFYFNKNSPLVKEMFRAWQNAIIAAIYDHKIRENVWRTSHLDMTTNLPLHEEMVHFYILDHYHDHEIPMSENRRLKPGIEKESLCAARNLHLMLLFWPKNRALLFVYIRELYENITTTLSHKDIHILLEGKMPQGPEFSLIDLADSEKYAQLQDMLAQ